MMLDTFNFLFRVRMASPTLSWTSLPPPLVSRGQNWRRMMQPVVSTPVPEAITVPSCLAGGFVRALNI